MSETRFKAPARYFFRAPLYAGRWRENGEWGVCKATHGIHVSEMEYFPYKKDGSPVKGIRLRTIGNRRMKKGDVPKAGVSLDIAKEDIPLLISELKKYV